MQTEAVQAEAIVEALQTQLWGGALDRDCFFHAVQVASASRGQPAFHFGAIDPALLYERALELLAEWNKVPPHQSMPLAFAAHEG